MWRWGTTEDSSGKGCQTKQKVSQGVPLMDVFLDESEGFLIINFGVDYEHSSHHARPDLSDAVTPAVRPPG